MLSHSTADTEQQKNRRDSDSVSQSSSTSQAVRDKLFLMKVEEMKLKAEKDVKAAMVSRQLELQKKREKLEKEMAQEQEMLNQEMDRKMSEARIKVLNAAEQEAEPPMGEDVDVTDSQHPEPTQDREVVRDHQATGPDSVLMMKLLLDQMKAAELPTLEPEVFKGDAARFNPWLSSFETHIESKTESPIQRLHFLAKYTGGEARRAISGLLHLRTEDSFKLAKEKLIDRYGNDFIIASIAVKSGIGPQSEQVTDTA